MGICMDINPYKFLAPWAEYELATRALEMRSPMVVLPMAWLTRLTTEELVQYAKEPDTETLAYWLERFSPLIKAARPEPVVLIMANRCGIEAGGANYAGTSAVICIQDGDVSIWGILGRWEEKCMVVDLSLVSSMCGELGVELRLVLHMLTFTSLQSMSCTHRDHPNLRAQQFADLWNSWS